MKKVFNSMFIFFISMLVLMFLTNNSDLSYSADKPRLSVGVAKVNITPKITEPMGRFTGVHDEFFIRVLAFSDGEKKAALVVAELKWIHDPLWEEVTTRISDELGIEKEYILMSAIHTHCEAPARVSSPSSTSPPSPHVVAYVEELKEKLFISVKEAFDNLKPARIGAGKGECRMNTNRRARAARGGIVIGRNPYKPCDQEVGVLRIDDERGNPVSIMINWPCHAVVMWPSPTLMSGDWPGAAARSLEKEFENKIITPVTIGASGDINPIYMVAGSNFDTQIEEMKVIGMYLSEEATRVAKEIETYPNGQISAVQRYLSLPRIERFKSREPNQEIVPGDDLRVRLSAIKVGNIVFTGIGGELMNEIGSKVKELSPYKHTFVVTHCNGSCGYLVTDEALKEGGLEPSRTRGMPGTDKALIDNLLEMINEL